MNISKKQAWGRRMGTDPDIIHRRARTLRKAIRCERISDGYTVIVYGCNEAARVSGLPHHAIYHYLTRSKSRDGVRGWMFEYIKKS